MGNAARARWRHPLRDLPSADRRTGDRKYSRLSPTWHHDPRIAMPKVSGRYRCRMKPRAEFPHRIVCLTEETTETLYLLGEDWRIVGISGFTVRPARARREKPKVSAFTSARIERIVELSPDLVLGFSDLQADIAAALIRAGIEMHVFNHRTVRQI